MIFDIVQTVSNFSASYEARRKNQVIGGACLSNNLMLGGTCDCHFMGNNYALSYMPEQQIQSWFKPRQEKTGVPYLITQDSRAAGGICIKVSEGGFFSRFDYFFMELHGRVFSMYQVGLGKAGIMYPIYRGDSQIALLEKSTVTYHQLDVYHVSAFDTDEGLVAFLFGLYMDMQRFGNRGEAVHASVEKTYIYTTKKALKEKYDPRFKSKIEE